MSPRPADLTSAHVTKAWQAAPESLASTHSWNSDTVVYVHDRAETHWLGADAAAVFLALRSAGEPLTSVELAAALKPDAADAVLLDEVLAQLVELGLAVAVPFPP